MLDPARALALLSVLFLGSCADRAEETASAPDATRVAPAAPAAASQQVDLEPIAAEPALAKAREDLSETDGAAEEPVALDPTRVLRGRVVANMPLPADEELVVTLGITPVPPEVDAESAEAILERFDFGPLKLVDVTATTPLPDGTFELPRPVGVQEVSVRVRGRYVSGGSFSFAPGGDQDPGDGRFELEAYVGGRATLALDVSGMATDAERAQLVGHSIRLILDQHRSGLWTDTSIPGILSDDLRSEFGPLRVGTYQVKGGSAEPNFGRTSGLDVREPLAPFHVVEGFRFDAVPGESISVRVPVKRGRKLEGVVVRADGSPVSGSLVRISTNWRFGGVSGGGARERQTDESGRFAFAALPGSTDSMVVEAAGLRRRRFSVNEVEELLDSGQPVRIEMDAGRTLVLEVKAPDGRPVVGLSPGVRSADGESGQRSSGGRTGEDGRLKLEALPAQGDLLVAGTGRSRPVPEGEEEGEQVLYVSDVRRRKMMGAVPLVTPGDAPLWTVQERIPAAAIDTGRPFALTLLPAPTVSGRVQGVETIQGGKVEVHVISEDPRMGMRSLQFQRFRGDGTFEVDQGSGAFSGIMAPGSYIATALVRVDLVERKSPPVRFTVATDDIEIELSLDSGGSVTGQVLLEDGTPLEGVPVTFVRIGARFGEVVGKPQTTGPDGIFDFGFHPPGEYYVRPASPRHLQAGTTSFTIEDSGAALAPLRVVMEPAGAVRVRVMGTDGVQVEDAACALMKADGRAAGGRPIEGDPEWEEALGPVAPGEYMAVHQQPGFGEATLQLRTPVSVEAGRLTEVVIHQVESPVSTVSGLVTSGGEPAPDMTVWISGEGGVVGQARTGTDGRYVIPTMESGPLRLGCGTYTQREFVGRPVLIGAGEQTLEALDVPSGAVEGQIKGATFDMGQAVVFRAEAPDAKTPFRYSGGSSNGHFRIPYLPDGKYLVTVLGPRGQRGAQGRGVEVEVAGGETVRGVELGSR